MASGIKINQLSVGGAVTSTDEIPISRSGQETLKVLASQFVTTGANIGAGSAQLYAGKTTTGSTTLQFRSLSGDEYINFKNVNDTLVLTVSTQNPTKTSFISNGSQLTYSLLGATSINANNYRVDIDGILQEPFVDYTVSNGSIRFTSAPPLSSKVVVVSNNLLRINENVPADGSITTNKLLSGIVTAEKLGSDAPLGISDKYNSSTGFLSLPAGTTLQRPVNAQNGYTRFNTSLGCVETCYYGFWIAENPNYTDITNKSVVVFREIAANQTWTVPANVSYIFVKMWGAGGGGGAYGGWVNGGNGGGGGYSEAFIPVNTGQVITMRVGNRGYATWSNNKAWPDGGGSSTGGGDNKYAGSGGGSSSISVPTIPAWCMYAGGGGGGGSCYGYAVNAAGAGGGINGEDGFTDWSSYTPLSLVGKGGTQTAGGAAGVGANSTGGAGSANQGGTHQNANCYGGGGGGGYYGGGSGAYGSNSMSGGGGGSGFIHPSLLRGVTLTGTGQIPPRSSDPIAVQNSTTTGYRVGWGAEEACSGGAGLIAIYY